MSTGNGKRRGRKPRGGRKVTFQDWYAKNAERLSEVKRKRYETDEAYRNSIREAAKRRYRESNLILDGGGRVVMRDGQPYVGYKLSKVADLLGVNRNTFRGWVYNGAFPSMRYDNTKLQFVTADQIPLLQKFVDTVKKDERNPYDVAADMREYLRENWRNRDVSEKIISEKIAGR